ncbi:MAG: Transcriptional regulator [Candidatus Levybacteria bacterium GW2011_GWA2_40_8]|nr:MAG: Transcriptional regulator [Candidatus Levybacteria bacterium GW2011_GWA2_40_8]
MADKKEKAKKEDKVPGEKVESDIEEAPRDDKAEEKNEESETPEEKVLKEPQEPQGELIVDVSEKKSYGWLLIVGAILAVIILLGGLLFYYKGIQNSNIAPTPTPSPTPVITGEPAPTASPEAKLDRMEYGIEVLNGSGKSGQAALMQEVLEEAGFKVNSIGNADDSSYTDSEISAKEGVKKDFLSELVGELSKTYVVSKKIGDLEDSEDSDITIVVGSSRVE